MVTENLSTKKTSQIRETISVSVRLLKIIWGIDRWLFLGYGIAILVPAVIPFINIYIYKLIIDMVSQAIQLGSFDVSKLFPLITLRVVTYFVQDSAFSVQRLMEFLITTKIPVSLNQLVLGKISSLDIQYFENSEFRDLLERVRDTANFRPQRLVNDLFYLLQSTVQIAIALVAIVNLNWLLALLVAAISIPEFIAQTLDSKLKFAVWNKGTAFRKRYWYLYGLLQSVQAIKEMKIFHLAGHFLGELKSIDQKFYNENKPIVIRSFNFNVLFNVLSTLVFVGVEIYVIFQAIARRLTIGDISFYTGVIGNFQNGLGGFFRTVNDIYDTSLYVKSIFDVLDAEPIIVSKENSKFVNFKKPPVIEFKDINFAYPDTNKKILRNFNLTINPGDKIAFVGENGAGKSTIIKLLARFYDISSGELLINGVNIKDINLESWYKQIGVLFQDFNRYEDQAKKNIHFGRIYEDINLENIINASVLSGAHPVIEKLDKKYEQMLGRTFEDGAELSTGQWQKVALARGFLRDAPILVLDEPTASIDAKAESEIFNKVEKLSKDKTVIIISHRFSTVRNADKIYVIDGGKITESGSHEALMRLNGQYATLFKLQAKGYQ